MPLRMATLWILNESIWPLELWPEVLQKNVGAL